MAITRGTKKWWTVHIAAGVVTVALIATAMTQCSDKEAERAKKEAAKYELKAAQETLDSLCVSMDKANKLIGRQSGVIRAKSDTINMQRDSIAKLNDSLVAVNAKLANCNKDKKKQKKSTQSGQSQQKPKPEVSASVKPDTLVIVYQGTVAPVGAGATDVRLNNSQNNGAIVAGGATCKTSVTLDNGSVNNGVIVLGDGNNVVVTAPAALNAADSTANASQVKKMQFTSVFVTRSR